jgi:hypothetical protein
MAEGPDHADARPRRRAWRFLGILGSAFLVAMATAIGTGLGSDALDLFDDDEEEPVSYSAFEEVAECGTQLFVSGDRAGLLASGETPSPLDWEAFKRDNRASVASESVVEVSIQGETSRTITLSRIDFTVERRPRPAGANFVNPCGDSIRGRFLAADLDSNPVAVISSSQDPKGVLDEVDSSGRSPYKPIRFPWTVSVTDPLLLQIVARTKRCFCTWRAEITWRSGGQSGAIPIDNDGKGYTVVGVQNVREFVRSSSSPGGWARLER